jgi:glycosyltransferase involved in cell wall biosynthesis
MKINILLFWFGRRWGEGRTYQKVAEHLTKIPEVRQVVCMFPPNPVKADACSWPMEIKEVGQKLTLLSQNTHVVPVSSRPYRFRGWVNRFVGEHALPVYLRTRGFRRDTTMLWMFPPHPYIDKLVKTIPHTLLIAHIVDNFTKLEEDKRLNEYATTQYPRLRRDADVIITGSDFNYRLFSVERRSCYLFENAADEAFFGEPSSLPYLSGASPRLGYVGTISQRTDIGLLEYVARARPEWELHIAGRQEVPLNDSGLLNLPNVRYLDTIPYQEVPSFLKSLDVCLIPHKNTDYCKSMSPLKLFQYLASGKPIVSTNIEGLERLKEHILIGQTYGDFVTCIEHALREDTVELGNRRIEAARKETWDRRVQEMFVTVRNHFLEKELARE